ncbi:hypothetical protein SISSUDRAFT_1067335 [Sistotremastrum suecicum HHB10207 ss-3]|uniref:Uncharacterized protein n=1 Tax=Sistotremastrum suecicum HHB10207 ss-3 TaxID=1314776 RepID=A0A165X8G7_9AGAM|nr:hypothetical protein SISSUDRAFT_1067335 [Sistotremastrum suecicum HHB10207 ss-3]
MQPSTDFSDSMPSLETTSSTTASSAYSPSPQTSPFASPRVSTLPQITVSDPSGEPKPDELGIPSYVFGDSDHLPPLMPPSTLNLTLFLFLSPITALADKIIEDKEDQHNGVGPPKFKLPVGLAYALEYQATLVRDYILGALDRFSYPDKSSFTSIPPSALLAVQMTMPSIFTSPMTKTLHQSFPKELLLHFFSVAQSDIRSTLIWIQDCKYRCTHTHLNVFWSWDTIADIDGVSAVYSMEKAMRYLEEHVTRGSILTSIAQARHWPTLAARARQTLEVVERNVETWNRANGVRLDQHTNGSTRSFTFVHPRTITTLSTTPAPVAANHPHTSISSLTTFVRKTFPSSASSTSTPIASSSTPIAAAATSSPTDNTSDEKYVAPYRRFSKLQTARRSKPFSPGHHFNQHYRPPTPSPSFHPRSRSTSATRSPPNAPRAMITQHHHSDQFPRGRRFFRGNGRSF